MNLSEWIIAEHDAYVASRGDDGATVKESREAVSHRYAEAARTGEIDRPTLDLFDEGRDLFDRHVAPARTGRREHMRRDIEWLLAGLRGELILDSNTNPAFAVPYPTGQGGDKVLRLWTSEDWAESANTRYRKAAEGVAAAKAFDDFAQEIVAEMQVRGCRTTGDLFTGEDVK